MPRPSTFPLIWKPLLEIAGSVEVLTQALGLRSYTSLWRIAHGKTVPSRAVMCLLIRYCKEHAVGMPLDVPND